MDYSRLQFIPSLTPRDVAAEIKAIRDMGAKARKDPKLALELLVATGMYTKAGKLKKQFR